MPFSGATKKLQQVADMGDELFAKISDLREQVQQMGESVERTDKRVGRIERRLEHQGAIIEAIATDHEIDVEAVITQAAIGEAEATKAGDASSTPSDSEPGGMSRGEEGDAEQES